MSKPAIVLPVITEAVHVFESGLCTYDVLDANGKFVCEANDEKTAADLVRMLNATGYDPPCPDMDLSEQVRHARGFANGVCRDDHHVARLLLQMARSIEALAALNPTGDKS